MQIRVNVCRQQLELESVESGRLVYPVSTALNGTGQTMGRFQTPLGDHIVRARIGVGAPINAVFKGRRPTGEIFSADMLAEYPQRDWILTRILWLSGTQPGFNRLGEVDTMRRFIYIHGTPYEDKLGQSVSHGCVRMANADVVDLFDRVKVGCPVEIVSGGDC